MAQWNIYCETERSAFQTWNSLDSPPTHCPNDPNHIINPNSVSLLRLSRIRLTNSTVITTNSTDYVPLINYITQGSNISNYDGTSVIAIKIVASIDSGSYDYCFVTVSDENILYTSTGNTNTTPIIMNVPIQLFSNIPRDETSIDIRFKTSGGNLTLRNVSVYYTTSPE